MSKTENKIKPLAVFLCYQELIQEYKEKYGEIASRVDKNYMYEKVSKKFLISAKYAGQLIRYVMTHRSEFHGYEAEVEDVMAFIRKTKTPVKKWG